MDDSRRTEVGGDSRRTEGGGDSRRTEGGGENAYTTDRQAIAHFEHMFDTRTLHDVQQRKSMHREHAKHLTFCYNLPSHERTHV